jgi:hypothetical protein
MLMRGCACGAWAVGLCESIRLGEGRSRPGLRVLRETAFQQSYLNGLSPLCGKMFWVKLCCKSHVVNIHAKYKVITKIQDTSKHTHDDRMKRGTRWREQATDEATEQELEEEEEAKEMA